MTVTPKLTTLAAAAIGAAGLLANAIVPADGLAAGVKTAPEPSGSLERTFRHCDTTRDPDLHTTTCRYSYFVDPPFSDDPKTYSVHWTQIAVEPRKGWCFGGALGSISQAGSSIAAWVPDPSFIAGPSSARLRVESRGRPLGSVAQRFRLGQGTLSARVDRRSQGDRYRWRWRGRTKEKVLLVVGVGFARPPSDDEFVVTSERTEIASVRC